MTDVRVRIEGDGVRSLVAQRGAHSAQELALAVLAGIKHRSAVQAEQNVVELASLDRSDDRIA